VAVDPVTDTIYVTNFGSGTVTVIDGATNTVARTITLNVLGATGVAVNPRTDTVYVSSESGGPGNAGTVSVINGATGAVTRTVDLPSSANSLAVDPVTDTVYVADGSGVSVIRGSASTATTITAGNGPYGVGVDPSTNTVYVTNANSDNVSVIDGATSQVTAAVDVGTLPQGVAVDPVTHAVYVANVASGTVSVITPPATVIASELLAALHQAVQHVGVDRILADTIAAAQRQLAAGHTRLACHSLTWFIIQVRLQVPWIISPGQGAQLIMDAKNIQAVLAC
jgi:YVTN family beta-propeller protein